jgi:hypothetical protein
VTRRVAIEELADALAAGPGSDLKTIVDVQSEEVA